MALHIRLGKFDWEQDRIQAVQEALRKKCGHSGLRVVHSGLTIRGRWRRLLRIQKGGNVQTKYVVYPGEIASQKDGDRHFVSSRELMRLYGVHPEECIVSCAGRPSRITEDLIPLFPRYDGNYSIEGREDYDVG